MGRPRRLNADYFSHDADASANEKIVYLESLFGDSGYAWYFKMLEALTAADRYEIPWSDVKCAIYARKFNADRERFAEFIVGATTPEIQAFIIENGVLYSPGLKKRLSLVDERRLKEAARITENREKNIVGATTAIVGATNTQSKVKESNNSLSPAHTHEAGKSGSLLPPADCPPVAPPPPPVAAVPPTLSGSVAAAKAWAAENPEQLRGWASVAKFAGDWEQETAKFFSHYCRDAPFSHPVYADPVKFFTGGFQKWLITARDFSAPKHTANGNFSTNASPNRHSRAVVVDNSKFRSGRGW